MATGLAAVRVTRVGFRSDPFRAGFPDATDARPVSARTTRAAFFDVPSLSVVARRPDGFALARVLLPGFAAPALGDDPGAGADAAAGAAGFDTGRLLVDGAAAVPFAAEGAALAA